jgi:hypothetical protein
MEARSLGARLEAEPTQSLGEPVVLTLRLENPTEEDIQLLTWGTPLEDELTADCLTVERDGEVIPYDGKLVKRGEPTAENYVVLPAGGHLETTVDVSEAYPIESPGEYTVTVDTIFPDAFTIAEDAKEAPRRRRDHESMGLEPAATSFKVLPGDEPKPTVGERARRSETGPRAKSSAKAPTFNGGTTAEQDETTIAHGNAQYFAALAADQLRNTTASSNGLYETWFGNFDQGRYDTLTEHYEHINNVLLTEQVTYDLTRTGCKPSWYAYTYSGSRTVWLCAGYFNAQQIGTDCKFGTLVHEWSHAVSDTEDHAYGTSSCEALANSDPGQAIDNADSHEYFTERLAQSDYGKSFTFITDRSTFGRDEIDAMLAHTSPATISRAFYVVADGYWQDKLGISSSSLGSPPSVAPNLSLNPALPGISVQVTALEPEDTALPPAPQRFTWVCDITFSNHDAFPANQGETSAVTIHAQLGTLSSGAQIHLVHEPNPYELDGPVDWLSTDLRVFKIRAGESRFGAAVGSTPVSAATFIQQVVDNLNSGSSGGQTFDGISTDPQTSALELAESVSNTRVFNFAVAKVRYRGTIDISDVRVFFRLFPAATTSTAFDPSTTYRRSAGSSPIALPGLGASGELLTIPCFAEARVDSAAQSVADQIDPTNVRTIVNDPDGLESVAYFGCWLDINQTRPQFPVQPSPADGPWSSNRKSIQELLRNAHQCLVAEIAFDPDPIPAGATPGSSDNLAQRNLSIVDSANPGRDGSRRVATTFDLRPTVPTGKGKGEPDELLIEWGDTPPESVASVFIPEIDASHILALADKRNPGHGIVGVDDQTVQVPVGGISYLPLPPGASFDLTGLLTVDLPEGVRKGNVYTIVVRQVTEGGTARVPLEREMQEVATPQLMAMAHDRVGLIHWRRIAGSYQITVPVRWSSVMLPRETRLLGVLKWILQSMSTEERWYPVFSRYVGTIEERVGGLGGEPDAVKPSPSGDEGEGEWEGGGERDHGREREGERDRDRDWEGEVADRQRHEGKVAGVVYDCFGDFEGFLLDECGTEVTFRTRERRMEDLVRLAWRERIAIRVEVTAADPHRPSCLVLKRT